MKLKEAYWKFLLLSWQRVQVWGNGSTCYLLTQQWANIRVTDETLRSLGKFLLLLWQHVQVWGNLLPSHPTMGKPQTNRRNSHDGRYRCGETCYLLTQHWVNLRLTDETLMMAGTGVGKSVPSHPTMGKP